MIAVDTNILVYAHRADSEHHQRARSAVEELVRSGRRLGVPWACVHEFLAIVTHPRIYGPPSTAEQAMTAIRVLVDQPNAALLGESIDHLGRLAALLEGGSIRGPKIHDARVAAVCLAHGVTELWSADRDFSYFPGLRTKNPLAS